jgi:ferredoxin-nitrite reductase
MMNKVEVLKAEKDGLDIEDSIAQYAELGWEAISEEDIHRLKWYGVFLRNPTPGFFMVRVRIPGGRTTTEQIRTLAHLAKTYGNGLLDLTTRQQFQLRQLRIAHVPGIRVNSARTIRCNGYGRTPHARVYWQPNVF